MPHRCQATRRTTVLFSPHCRVMRRIMGLLLFPHYRVISKLTNLFFPCCRAMRGTMGFVVSSLPGHVRGNMFVVFLVAGLLAGRQDFYSYLIIRLLARQHVCFLSLSGYVRDNELVIFPSLSGNVQGNGPFAFSHNIAAPQFRMYMFAGIIVGDICNSK